MQNLKVKIIRIFALFSSIILIGCIPSTRTIREINETQGNIEAKIDILSNDLGELRRQMEIQRTEIQRTEVKYSVLSNRLDKLEKMESTSIKLKKKTPSNLYLIADSYYQQGDFINAILAYQSFIDTYPNERRVADAYLKQGLSLIKIGREERAKYFFKTVIDKFPDSEDAIIAKEKLNEIEKQ